MTCDSPHRCWAEIDRSALRSNLARCRTLASGARIMAVVKADAYGHGLEAVVHELREGADWFGVANLQEGLRVRRAAAPECPVLLLGPALPFEIEAVVAAGLSASVSNPAEVAHFELAARKARKAAKLHAVVDTGMGRIGAQPAEFAELLQSIAEAKHCRLEGVSTHFPSADEDADFTRSQIEAFRSLLGELGLARTDCLVHLANSAGLLGHSGETGFAALARPGLALYGVSPLGSGDCGLKPAMSLKSRLALVRRIPAGASVSYGRTFVAERPMRVGTVAVGYGDGYPRSLSGKGAEVLVRGRRCPLLGRVTMDQIVVDLAAVEGEVTPGEEAVLFGGQEGADIPVAELATKAGTIPWEVFTGITSRVERVYL